MLIYLLVFISGLSVGSFLNVILFRLDKKNGILIGRSECQECLARLKWQDLVPLFSYLYLRGNCRYCKAEISIIYPTVEFTTGLAAFSFFLINGLAFSPFLIYLLITIALLILLLFFDLLYLILPDKITFTLVGTALVYNFFFRKPEITNLLLSAFLFGLIFAIIYLVSHGEWMGFGDAKLAFAIGLILGYPMGLLAIVFAVWVAAFWGIGLMLLGKATLKTALPFGSFMAGASILFIIFQPILNEKIYFIF